MSLFLCYIINSQTIPLHSFVNSRQCKNILELTKIIITTCKANTLIPLEI